MKKYFVAKEGIQKGPWTLDEITQNIQSKVLSWNDYIYDEKVNVWLFLFEFPSLTESFNRSFKNPLQKTKTITNFDTYKDRVWYILKSNENYGPFTASEMVQMLQSRTLFEYDFVWRQDQSSWQRVSDVSEFKHEKIKELFEVSAQENTEIQKTFFRRRFPRVEYKCELLIHDHQKVYSAQSIEISAGGASFKLDNVNFEVDDQVYLHFKPGGDVPAFNATCKIVSKSSNKYGVSFTNVSNSVKEQIVKYTKKAA
jgi:hypothetical protein